MNRNAGLERIYFYAEKCMMCMACVFACENRHAKEAHSSIQIEYQATAGTPWIWACRQCLTPPCVEACFAGGLTRTDGTAAIEHDQGRCVGCGSCVLACPIEGVRFISDPRLPTKCDMCGQNSPPDCVKACPSGALVYTDAQTFNKARQKCYAKKLKYID